MVTRREEEDDIITTPDPDIVALCLLHCPGCLLDIKFQGRQGFFMLRANSPARDGKKHLEAIITEFRMGTAKCDDVSLFCIYRRRVLGLLHSAMESKR